MGRLSHLGRLGSTLFDCLYVAVIESTIFAHVKGAQNGIASEWPPRVISNKSVRDLYARSSTTQEIAKRFSGTLDLNPLFRIAQEISHLFPARS